LTPKDGLIIPVSVAVNYYENKLYGWWFLKAEDLMIHTVNAWNGCFYLTNQGFM